MCRKLLSYGAPFGRSAPGFRSHGAQSGDFQLIQARSQLLDNHCLVFFEFSEGYATFPDDGQSLASNVLRVQGMRSAEGGICGEQPWLLASDK